MREISLEFLYKTDIDKSKEFILEINPKGCLSMVTSFPGSINNTSVVPSDKMILGLIENHLKFHFELGDRNEIIKLLSKTSPIYKEQKKVKRFESIIKHLIDFELINLDEVLDNCSEPFFDAACHHKRKPDSLMKKNETFDISLNNKMYSGPVDYSLDDHLSKSSYYFSSLVNIEYVIVSVPYRFKCKCDPDLYNFIMNEYENSRAYYLGNSEGLVEITII